MILFGLGLGLFFGAHGFLLTPAASQMAAGPVRKLSVTALSLAGVVLIVLGWGQASALGVAWTPPVWARHVTLALMLPSFILLAAAYLPAGRIKKYAKHPMLAGVKVWAFAHLVSNGEWRSIALFAGFLAYAVLARIAAKRRGDQGASGATPGLLGDVAAVGVGAVAYLAVAYWLHPVLFGVAVVG